jgi:Fe-Mn family superoxide dismutase
MQNQYQEKKFELQGMKGLSEKQVTEHLKLYGGYVKNANKLSADIATLQKDENNAIVVSELRRRFGFEWNGMRLHEYYFEGLGEQKTLGAGSDIKKAIEAQWGGFDDWAAEFKKAGMMRGIGWVVLFYDPATKNLFNCWITDHEMGHLAGLPVLLAMDVWEHAYIIDYLPSQRKEYIETFFGNLRWNVIEERFGKHL